METAARAEAIRTDRAKTAAIYRYVKASWDALCNDLPFTTNYRNRYSKRNDLMRLGRRRFLQEPVSVQEKFFKAGESPLLAGAHVRESLQRSLESGSVGDRKYKTPRPSSAATPLDAVAPTTPSPSVRRVRYRVKTIDPSRSGVRELGVGMGSVGEASSASPSSRASPPQAIPDSLMPELIAAGSASDMSSKGDSVPQCPASPPPRASMPARICDAPSRTRAKTDSETVSVDVRECASSKPEATSMVGEYGCLAADLLVSPTHRRTASRARDTLATKQACSQNYDELTSVLGGTLVKLQQWFGYADGAAVLAASYRIKPHASKVHAPVKQKAAAILSLAAKMNHEVDNNEIRKIWCHVAGAGNIAKTKIVEFCIFQRLALDGLVGPYASGESLARLAESD